MVLGLLEASMESEAFMGKIHNTLEAAFTFKLVDIFYSEKHGQEICLMALSKTSIFPSPPPEQWQTEVLRFFGLSHEDALQIPEISALIQKRKEAHHLREVHRNGTVVLEGPTGELKRYSERNVSEDRALLKDLPSIDAHDIGYRVGFREGLQSQRYKMQARPSLKKARNTRDKILKLKP